MTGLKSVICTVKFCIVQRISVGLKRMSSRNGSTGNSSHWLIDKSMVWSLHRLFAWLIDHSIVLLIHGLIDRLIDWLIDNHALGTLFFRSSNPLLLHAPLALCAALTVENCLDLVREHDVILDCTDNVYARYLLNDACVLTGRPLVSASALKFDGQVFFFNFQFIPKMEIFANGTLLKSIGPGRFCLQLTVYNFRGSVCRRCLFPDAKILQSQSCDDNGVMGPGKIHDTGHFWDLSSRYTRPYRLVCLIDWLIDWFASIDWLIDRSFLVWLIDWLIDWFASIDWLIDRFWFGWLIDWLIDWLVDWLIEFYSGLAFFPFPRYVVSTLSTSVPGIMGSMQAMEAIKVAVGMKGKSVFYGSCCRFTEFSVFYRDQFFCSRCLVFYSSQSHLRAFSSITTHWTAHSTVSSCVEEIPCARCVATSRGFARSATNTWERTPVYPVKYDTFHSPQYKKVIL